MSPLHQTKSPFPETDLGAGLAARVKRFHSKSRKGCMTCRQRRVKCDEQRNPNCARCDKGGYLCEWQDSRASSSRASEDRNSPTATRSPSRAPLRSEDDSIPHKFFAEGVVENVCSLLQDMTESLIVDATKAQSISNSFANFYHQLVHQASLESPIIRKTLSALCVLYERACMSSCGLPPHSHDHIGQYSEALSNLRTSSRELNPEIVLIASILFANCEYLMGDLCSALRHLRAGAKILDEQTSFPGGRLSKDLCETLRTIFETFEHASIELQITSPGSDQYNVLSDHAFADIAQANTDLLQLYSHAFALQRLNRSHPHHTSSVAHEFHRWSNTWRNRANTLSELIDTTSHPWLQILYAQHTALQTIINSLAQPVEHPLTNKDLDDLTLQVSTFRQICSDAIESPRLQARPFTENIGLILPLFLIIMRYFDADKCEEALCLLRRLQVVEGVWSSCCAYAIGRAILTARRAMKIQSGQTASNAASKLPVAEITKFTILDTGTEMDITITFPEDSRAFDPSESNAIVGGFCGTNFAHSGRICAVLEASGYQGPVLSYTLHDCSCQDT